MNKNQCMDSPEVKGDNLGDTGGEITFKGWNIKDAENLIYEELEECWENHEILDFKIIEKKEHAFSCSRFCEEQDAKDEGYNYWLDYHYEWKRGLGKCTTFTIEYKLKYRMTGKGVKN